MISQKDKKLLCQLAKFTCEQCKEIFELKDLEIHRIRRQWEGGTYQWRNCMVLCKFCHKLFHSKEYNFISG